MIKTKVGYKDEDDGCFWMCWEDVQTYFSNIGVNRVQSDSDLYGTMVSQELEGFVFLTCTVPKGVHVFSIS